MNFENFSTWVPLLMWIGFEQVLKLTNLINKMNSQNHVQAMKIWPKTEKMNMASYDKIFMHDHEETWFIRFWDFFHEIRVKKCFAIWGEKESHGVQWKKKFWSWWKVLWVVKTREKLEFSYLEFFFSLDQLRWNGKFWKLKLNPLFSPKSQLNSHTWAPLTLSKSKWRKWGSYCWKWGVI